MKYLVTWRNILPHVMDERYSWMEKWMDFQMMSATKLLQKIKQKKQDGIFHVGLSSNIQHMKC
jgi:hypothetical protein